MVLARFTRLLGALIVELLISQVLWTSGGISQDMFLRDQALKPIIQYAT